MKSENSAPWEPKLYRLIDANLNRLREGIRVVEDLERFIFENQDNAAKLKALRHSIRYDDPKLLHYRNIQGDLLKATTKSESQRKTPQEIKKANMKRAQEAARVLEESFKLINKSMAEHYKKIRYELYDIEKLL